MPADRETAGPVEGGIRGVRRRRGFPAVGSLGRRGRRMSRIFWDSMLFIYLLEDHPAFSQRARHLLDRAYRRGDLLFTRYLALGEIMAGAEKSPQSMKREAVRQTLDEMGFSY